MKLLVATCLIAASSVLGSMVAQADQGNSGPRAATLQVAVAPTSTATSVATPAATTKAPSIEGTPAAAAPPPGNVTTAAPPAAPPKSPSRFDYSLSASTSFPTGNLGYNVNALRGIIQGVVGYQIDPLTKIVANAFQVPAALIGINGSVPLYIRGNAAPVGSASVPPTNPVGIYKIASISVQRTVFIDHHPIIVTPGYLTSFFEYDDALTIENTKLGRAENIRLRSFQNKFVAVTLPLVLKRNFIALATVNTEWLMAPHGLNQTNHPQLELVGYAEYFANQHTSFFVQPSRFIAYVQSDPYPEYSFTPIAGVNYRFTKNFWAQGEVISLNPTNYRNLGVTGITCATSACASVAPNVGSIKATTISISFGIGKPFVAPL